MATLKGGSIIILIFILSCASVKARTYETVTVHHLPSHPEKNSWCNAIPIKQDVSHVPECTPITIDNKVCLGACFSYSVPKAEDSEPITPYCDKCDKVTSSWTVVTLNCTNAENGKPYQLTKSVELISNCSCVDCSTGHPRQAPLEYKNGFSLLEKIHGHSHHYYDVEKELERKAEIFTLTHTGLKSHKQDNLENDESVEDLKENEDSFGSEESLEDEADISSDSIENNELDDTLLEEKSHPKLHLSKLKSTEPDLQDIEEVVDKLMIQENKILTDEDDYVRKDMVKTLAASANHE